MGVELRIRNPAFFALDYCSIVVSIGDRGTQLGSVAARGGRISARVVSLVHAKLKLNRIRFPKDVYLIQDLARGSLPLDTVTVGEGRMLLFFFDAPVKDKISCSVMINPETQRIVHQDCYPEKLSTN